MKDVKETLAPARFQGGGARSDAAHVREEHPAKAPEGGWLGLHASRGARFCGMGGYRLGPEQADLDIP